MNPIIIETPLRAITKYNGMMTSRRGGIFLRPEVKEFEAAVRSAALKAYKGEPLAGPLRVDIDFYFSNNRMPDLFNLPKAVCDALNTKIKGIIVHKGIWLDDRQIVQGTLTKRNSGQDKIVIKITNVSAI